MSNEKMGFAKNIKRKIRKFWEEYEKKIVLGCGMILVAIISFEVGILQGQKWQQDPLIIEKPKLKQVAGVSSKEDNDKSMNAKKNIFKEVKKTNNSTTKKNDCVFMASKKSNKYHKKDCHFAKRIKAENIICFKSEEDARKKGYIPAHCAK
ncbi:MAG TPA: hypothetical protein ENJ27_01635 [Candidatus Moranbacteria bacterium]|nr:hypothetical protein [Candidatus Moranbacteria bacterium]